MFVSMQNSELVDKLVMITRRNLLVGLVAAPAIVKATSIMRVRAYYDYHLDPFFTASHNPVTCENTFCCLVNGKPGLVTFTEDMSQITRIEELRL